jgi:hypothetical protein
VYQRRSPVHSVEDSKHGNKHGNNKHFYLRPRVPYHCAHITLSIKINDEEKIELKVVRLGESGTDWMFN